MRAHLVVVLSRVAGVCDVWTSHFFMNAQLGCSVVMISRWCLPSGKAPAECLLVSAARLDPMAWSLWVPRLGLSGKSRSFGFKSGAVGILEGGDHVDFLFKITITN